MHNQSCNTLLVVGALRSESNDLRLRYNQEDAHAHADAL